MNKQKRKMNQQVAKIKLLSKYVNDVLSCKG